MTPHVLIQPSYGNRQARENWANTLAQDIDFTTRRLRETLTDSQFALLEELHPAGRARFWGTTRVQDTKMDELRTGDVVLFTGQNHVLAVGEIGALFRNADAGDALWPPNEQNGPYQNVYSLINFQETEIPYTDLRKLTAKPGSVGGDNYMGARLLRDEAAQRVIDGLLIETTTERNAVAVEAGIWLPGDVVPDEAHNATTAAATPARPGFIAERRESALMVEYKEFLTASGGTRRRETPMRRRLL